MHRRLALQAQVKNCAAGFLLQRELQQLAAVQHPKRPLMCILGGAKVSDKLAVLRSLSTHAEVLAVGGAMAYTFLRSQGHAIGRSLVEEDRIEDARQIVAAAKSAGCELLLPDDHVVCDSITDPKDVRTTQEIGDNEIGVDIGPNTVARYAQAASQAKTIFWNGPMGIFENPLFAKGTEGVAQAVGDSKAHSVVGGGDSLAAVNQLGFADRISHLSTGGGASLELIEGRTLPGIAALTKSTEPA